MKSENEASEVVITKEMEEEEKQLMEEGEKKEKEMMEQVCVFLFVCLFFLFMSRPDCKFYS